MAIVVRAATGLDRHRQGVAWRESEKGNLLVTDASGRTIAEYPTGAWVSVVGEWDAPEKAEEKKAETTEERPKLTAGSHLATSDRARHFEPETNTFGFGRKNWL